MERYGAYKESGVEWIGDIPERWDVVPLNSLCSIAGGATPSKEKLEYWDGEIPWVSSQEVKSAHLRDTSLHITKDAVDSCSTDIYPAGCIVTVVRSGILKHTLPVAMLDVPMSINQDIKALSFKFEITGRYFFYYVMGLNDSLLRHLSKEGATVDNLDVYLFARCPIVHPSLDEQAKIADYLDAKTAEIDELIADCEREVGLLQEYRKAVISEAVTKGLDLDVPMKDSGIEWIGDIPKHWDAGKLLRHARLESGHTPSRLHPEWWIAEECTIPWITTQDVHRFRDGRITSIDDTELHVSQIGLDNSSARWLPAGTVALSRTASVGFSIVLSESMASSQDFADWIPDDSLDSYYLLYSLRSMEMVFKQLQMGSTHKTIYMPDIMKLAVAYPPVEEQRRIVSYLDAKTAEIDSLIEAKQQMADKLREYRKSLISEAVTGKFKVPGVNR